MNSKRGCAAILAAVWFVAFGEDVPFGFTPESGKAQLDRESQFTQQLNAENLREWSRHMTTRPHNVGSPKAKENAEYIAGLFRQWGYDTTIETYHVLFPTPKTRELEMLEPERFTASLKEEISPTDSAHDALVAEGLPPYNAYSVDGDVTAQLVFVNRGIPEDYEVLERHGVDVKGKIVLARYGGSWRGIKPKVAAEKGAIGCIIYNDPADDGFGEGDGYPKGAYKHETAVQRGSVQDLPFRPGDPLTPNRGATEHARRLELKDADSITKIPVLPISYADALPLMRAMRGATVPEEWRGRMPVTYRFGGDDGPVVRLKLAFNWDIVPAYDVIARMEGSERPNEWVIRGNHHDAWVIGARDPISGLITLLEQARATAELAKTGWRPRRTIVFCAWDGEEPGLLGSVEWVEDHAKELLERAVAYINTDSNSRGFLGMEGSHSLERMASETAKAALDPETHVSIAERKRANAVLNGLEPLRKHYETSDDVWLTALGSGSDYSPFIQHLGIPSFNLGFGGEGDGGEYHTSFDTFDHYSTFVDPKFEYGVALAEVCGRLTLRIADADVVPFDFTGTVRALSEYTEDLVKAADDLRSSTEKENGRIEKGFYSLAADPTKEYFPPTAKAPVPHFNFAPLQNAVEELRTAAEGFKKTLESALQSGSGLSVKQLERLDATMYRAEQKFIREEGLPKRPWYRHFIYAPGFYTGYGVKTLPAIREAIEQREFDTVDQRIAETAEVISAYTGEVKAARAILPETADGEK